MDRATLLYDGDCGFCTWAVEKVRRWLKPRARVVFWQGEDLDALGVTPEQCAESIQFIDASGVRTDQGQAVAKLLQVSRPPWPLVGAVIGLPGVVQVTSAAYRLVARNRYRLPGSTSACQLNTARKVPA